MPIRLTVDHDARLMTAVAEGDVTKLEFEEFLYKPDNQQFGETATPGAPNAHSGVKEMSCVGYAAEIWSSARLIQ